MKTYIAGIERFLVDRTRAGWNFIFATGCWGTFPNEQFCDTRFSNNLSDSMQLF